LGGGYELFGNSERCAEERGKTDETLLMFVEKGRLWYPPGWGAGRGHPFGEKGRGDIGRKGGA